MSKIDVNHNFYEDVKYDEVEKDFEDPDKKSNTLYEYHEMLWNKGCLNGLLKQDGCELKLAIKNNGDIQELRLGADIFIVLYMGINDENGELKYYKDMRENNDNEILNKQKEIMGNKRIKYTIGGSIIFPRFDGSLNQMRGCYRQVGDRIDITLLCIKMWYDANNGENENQNNPLWDCLNRPQNKVFFNLFGTGEPGFKNYINFFLFQDFVNESYEVKNLFALGYNETLSGSIFTDTEPNNLPTRADEWLNLYDNLTWAITQRTQRIKEYAKDKGLLDVANETQDFKIKFDLSSILHNK